MLSICASLWHSFVQLGSRPTNGGFFLFQFLQLRSLRMLLNQLLVSVPRRSASCLEVCPPCRVAMAFQQISSLLHLWPASDGCRDKTFLCCSAAEIPQDEHLPYDKVAPVQQPQTLMPQRSQCGRDGGSCVCSLAAARRCCPSC